MIISELSYFFYFTNVYSQNEQQLHCQMDSFFERTQAHFNTKGSQKRWNTNDVKQRISRIVVNNFATAY